MQRKTTESSLRQLVGTVLLSEGDPALSETLQGVLSSFGYLVTVAHNREEMQEQLRFSWNMIIVDLSLNPWESLLILGQVRESETARVVPCLALIDSEDTDFAVQCLKLGAYDYVTKLTEPEIMVAKLEAQLRFSSAIRRLAKENHALHKVTAFDELTRLYNSRSIKRVVAAELERAMEGQTSTAVLLLDLDHLKVVNDTFGNQAGDDVLAQLGALMQNTFRTFDSIGRYAGAQFCAVMPRISLEEASAVAERLRETVLHQPFESSNKRIPCTITGGIAWVPAGYRATPKAVLRCADSALYESKRAGRNQVSVRNLQTFADETVSGRLPRANTQATEDS